MIVSKPIMSGSAPPVQGDGAAAPTDQPANGATPAVASIPEVTPAAVPEEWEQMDVPEEWRPSPVMRVWGVHKAAREDELRALIEGQGYRVRSVTLDPKQETPVGNVAFVRLDMTRPPTDGDGAEPASAAPPSEPDANKAAEVVVGVLRTKDPKLSLRGMELHFERTTAETTLFLTSLPGELDESDAALRTQCEVHGSVERCFTMRNPQGASKGYALCEYSVPSAAAAAAAAWVQAGRDRKRALDEAGAEGKAESERAKRVRVEPAPGLHTVASLFAKVVYVTGVPPTLTDLKPLQDAFAQHGTVVTFHAPRNLYDPQRFRGLAFIQFAHSYEADAAWRALDGADVPGIGPVACSLANPSKAAEGGQQAGHAPGGTRGGHHAGRAPRGRFGFTPGRAPMRGGRGGVASRGGGYSARQQYAPQPQQQPQFGFTPMPLMAPMGMHPAMQQHMPAPQMQHHQAPGYNGFPGAHAPHHPHVHAMPPPQQVQQPPGQQPHQQQPTEHDYASRYYGSFGASRAPQPVAAGPPGAPPMAAQPPAAQGGYAYPAQGYYANAGGAYQAYPPPQPTYQPYGAPGYPPKRGRY